MAFGTRLWHCHGVSMFTSPSASGRLGRAGVTGRHVVTMQALGGCDRPLSFEVGDVRVTAVTPRGAAKSEERASPAPRPTRRPPRPARRSLPVRWLLAALLEDPQPCETHFTTCIKIIPYYRVQALAVFKKQ